MNTDIVIVGAGPAGIFTAIEMIRRGSKKHITIVEKGQPIEKRRCPKTVTKHCVNCRPYCHITTGFSGAGAFSDGKLSLSHEVGGDFPTLIGAQNAQDLIDYTDGIYLEFGADSHIEGIGNTEEVREIRRRAIQAGLKLVDCPIRHLGTEKAQTLYLALENYLRDNDVELLFGWECEELIMDGETCMGSDLVSALITCQKLGAVAFGLSCCDRPEKLYGHIEEIAPYAKVPIIVRPRAGEEFDKLLSPQEMAEQMKGLLQRGATILGGCCYTSPEHIEAIGRMMQTFDFSAVRRQREDEDTILMAGATEPYFLDEYFEQTEPVYCRRDMSDELLELEESGADVATIRIETVDDAYNFALNAHMLHMPVSFYSDSEEALEMALLMYNGCAFVDSRSELDEQVLDALAKGYGATVR